MGIIRTLKLLLGKKDEKPVLLTTPFNTELFKDKTTVYHCRSCGELMTEEEYVVNDGECDQCVFDDEDSDLILGDGW